MDGDRRADQRRDVERLVETVAKLNARMVELREENRELAFLSIQTILDLLYSTVKLLMRLVGAE